MKEEKYNGFTNRDTWLASLWIANNETIHNEYKRAIGMANSGGTPEFYEDEYVYSVIRSGIKDKIITDKIELTNVYWREVIKANPIN